jgi:hypothetical protein
MRRVAEMHGVAHSTLQRALAGKRIPKLISAANQQLLVPEEETSLKLWCLEVAKWGFPVRIDILRQMAVAILIDRKRRNMLDISDAFDTFTSSKDSKLQSIVETAADPKTGLLDISCIRPQ